MPSAAADETSEIGAIVATCAGAGVGLYFFVK